MADQQFERGSYSPNPINDTSIQSDNFGGLNTTATPFNLPYTDSPVLANAVVDVSGAVFKRGGTRVISNTTVTNGNLGSVVVPITTGLKYNYNVIKQGVNLNIYETVNDISTLVSQKLNVWSNAALTVRPGYTITSEVEPRIIFTTGVNKPVQLKFVEQTSTQTLAAGAVTTLTIPNASRYQYSNPLLYINRNRISGVSYSYSGGTLTVTGITGVNSDGSTPLTINLVGITWSWWAEATYWYGSSYYQKAFRNNTTTAAGDSVAIPSGLITNLSSTDYPAPSGVIMAYRSDNRTANTFTQSPSRQPSTATTYWYSDGQGYVAGSNNYVNPSPNFITFGAADTGAGYPISLVRRRQHGFKYGTGQIGSNIAVFVDGNLVSQATTLNGTGTDAVYGNYTLYDNTYTALTSSTANSYYVSFETNTIGVGFNSKVLVVNTEATHIGSSATSSGTKYTDGAYIAALGFGQFSDYGQGYYPRHVSLYQGRLVFCGFLNNPMLVLFSNQYDSVIPGTFYNMYQVNETTQALTDPFTITLTLEPNDRTIGTIEWQGFIFILCRRSVYRGSGGQNYPLSFAARNISYISNIGCVNEQSYCKTNTSVLYISDNGIYSLDSNGGEYVPTEQSIKIRSLFYVTLNPQYDGISWMRFESTNNRVYAGIPQTGELYFCRHILVYTVIRQSWTLYNTPRGFNCSHGGEYVDRQLGTLFCIVSCLNRNTSALPLDLVVARFDYYRYLDWCQRVVAPANTTLQFPPVPLLTFTTVSGQQVFPIQFDDGQNWLGFPVHPAQDVDDLLVTLNGQVLTMGTDYTKQANQWLYLSLAPIPGSVLTIQPKGGYTFIFQDNVPVTAYTVNSSGITTLANPANAVVEWGCKYLSIYTTPLFDQQTLAAFKRVKHIYVYLDNKTGMRTYQPADVNSNDSQDPQQLVGNYAQRMNVNLTMLYSSDANGQTTSDVYGYSQLVWDDAVFDIQPSSAQSQRYQLFKEAIQGVGYSYQFMLWSFDEATWRLAAYQIIANPKGQRYIAPY